MAASTIIGCAMLLIVSAAERSGGELLPPDTARRVFTRPGWCSQGAIGTDWRRNKYAKYLEATCTAGCGTRQAAWSVKLDTLDPGLYVITAYSTDLVGNVGPYAYPQLPVALVPRSEVK